MEQIHRKAFNVKEMNYVLTHLYSHKFCQKMQQLLLTPLKSHWWGSFKRRTCSYICIKKFDAGAKLLKNKTRSTADCLHGHKIKAVPSWKTIYPTDGPKNHSTIFLHQTLRSRRQHQLESQLGKLHYMGFDFELTYTPGEQIPYADALRKMGLDDVESDNNRVCFAINLIDQNYDT